MFHHKRRGRRKKDSSRRKDRLIQTRVGERLEQAIKDEAKRRRLTVSHLLRNVLEECFHLVDEVVDNIDAIASDSMEFAKKVTTDAKRAAGLSRRYQHYHRLDEPSLDDEAELKESRAETENSSQMNDIQAAIEFESAGVENGIDRLNHIYAWNKVILNQSALCSFCNSSIKKGEVGYVGLSDEPSRGRSWLCESCIEKL